MDRRDFVGSLAIAGLLRASVQHRSCAPKARRLAEM
jgi:hypothetical protein